MDSIKKNRERLGWTQTKLAQESGVSQTYISEIEAGKSQPTIKVLRKLASAMNISVSELLDENLPVQEDR